MCNAASLGLIQITVSLNEIFFSPSIIFRGILTFFVLKFLLIVIRLVWAPRRDCLTKALMLAWVAWAPSTSSVF